MVRTKKGFLCCSVLGWGTKNGLELSVACLSIIFSAVKSWKFVGLISLLFAGRSFKNCSTGMAGIIVLYWPLSDSLEVLTDHSSNRWPLPSSQSVSTRDYNRLHN